MLSWISFHFIVNDQIKLNKLIKASQERGLVFFFELCSSNLNLQNNQGIKKIQISKSLLAEKTKIIKDK